MPNSPFLPKISSLPSYISAPFKSIIPKTLKLGFLYL